MKRKLESLVRSRKMTAADIRRNQTRVLETSRACRPNFANVDFRAIASDDLRFLFQAVDENFFDSLISRILKAEPCPLSFRVSRRMTNSGGMTTMRTDTEQNRRSFEIAIASTLLFSSFSDSQSEAILVTGLPCHNRLEALQRIMEHEIIHLIEMLLWNESSCRQPRFKNIVSRFFGHRESHHRLLRPQDVARIRRDIRPGDWVQFSFQDRQLTGRVNRITKRATVLVPDPHGTPYDDGQRYKKYYVPISALRRSRPR